MSRFTRSLALLALLAFVAGCGERPPEDAGKTPGEPAAESHAGDEGHSHGEGPNGGAIADWGGGKYHVEFTVNHDAQEATVYVLGDDARSPAPIDAEELLLSIREPAFQVVLAPAPLEGESGGESSRFVGQHESLGIVREFAGTISGEADGTPYAGDFEEVAHDH